MATIVTFTPLQSPVRTRVSGNGCILRHACDDETGATHRQRLPLGSIRGVTHLDALCLHCGAHFLWVDDDSEIPAEEKKVASITPNPPEFS